MFFDTVLPSAGIRCIATPLAGGGFRHQFGPDNAWLANRAAVLDAAGHSVYFACASYLPQAEDKQRGPDGKLVIGGRKQTNVAFVRSFWVDLDVGVSEPGKPAKYATQKQAAVAILAFAVKLGLPKPWLVNSGWGVHAHWPMDADMVPSVWKPTAEALKRALTAHGVLFDPSRTADAASVLRPPGTHNRKGEPRQVKLVMPGDIGTINAFQNSVGQWLSAPDPFAAMGPPPSGFATDNSALGAGVGYDPSSAHKIADACGIVGMMRDTRGNIDQPTWYGVLGVLAQTIEAPEIAHEWSDGHPTYSEAETDTKLAQAAQYPPTTCVKLSEQHADICAACPYKGTITSPIQLGRERPQPSTVEVVEHVTQADGTKQETRQKLFMPPGYGEAIVDGRRVLTFTKIKKDKKGDVSRQTDVISSKMFWATQRLWVDDASQVEWEVETPEGRHLFVTPSNLIGKGGAEILGAMASNEVAAVRGQTPAFHGYLSAWFDHVTLNKKKVVAHRSFGWYDTTFVLGDVVLNPDTSSHPPVLLDMAKDRQKYVVCKGDLGTWVGLVDRAYNAPGQEAFQFQIGCAFAAPLLSLMQQVKGVTVYTHTTGSGKGKSTVQQVGLSVWGFWDEMMLTYKQTTTNSLWGLMGAYNSLPVVYDELTNAPNADISELVFSMSSGRGKQRMTASGGLRANTSNWSTIMMASGNGRLSSKLAQHRANPEAEISRLFEFTLEPTPHLTPTDANYIFPQFRENYGHAGRAFAEFIVPRRAKVAKLLKSTQDEITTELGLTQVERHWSALFAAVLVALRICRGLQLLSFDIDGIKAWMVQQLEVNRGQITNLVPDDESLITQMLGDLWENMLVTRGMGDRRTTAASVPVLKAPGRGPVVGRVSQPDVSSGEVPQLIVSRAAINDWASKKYTDADEMFRAAVAMGWCAPVVKQQRLGKGVAEYMQLPPMHCWVFYPAAMGAAAGPVVQPLTVVASQGSP